MRYPFRNVILSLYGCVADMNLGAYTFSLGAYTFSLGAYTFVLQTWALTRLFIIELGAKAPTTNLGAYTFNLVGRLHVCLLTWALKRLLQTWALTRLAWALTRIDLGAKAPTTNEYTAVYRVLTHLKAESQRTLIKNALSV
jgi:hypothetical protein